MKIKMVCENCGTEEILGGDTSNFNIVSYPNSTQVSAECVICGTTTDFWTWESTMDLASNEEIGNHYIESNDFNNFLELFEEEEFKEEHCLVCGKEIKTRDTIIADDYVCEECINKLIDSYTGQISQ